jgi:hypothetical protein
LERDCADDCRRRDRNRTDRGAEQQRDQQRTTESQKRREAAAADAQRLSVLRQVSVTFVLGPATYTSLAHAVPFRRLVCLVARHRVITLVDLLDVRQLVLLLFDALLILLLDPLWSVRNSCHGRHGRKRSAS